MKDKLFPLIILLLVVSCAPLTPTVAEPTVPPSLLPQSTSTPLPQSDFLIRYAIPGAPTIVNSWALFDEAGASYENYALRGEHYPRLYDLLPPDDALTPRLALEKPSPISKENDFYTATITLKENLTWSDGTPLTAQDVAFTANTALAFQLGLNWANFYNPEKLHHLEALNETTLKYYFSAPPSTADWQYGVLNAPFLSENYWQPKIAEIEDLLPLPEDDLRMAEYQREINALQEEVDAISSYMTTLKEKSAEYRGQEQLLLDRENRRDSLIKKLELARREKREKFAAARSALYALPADDEPLAGLWQPASPPKNIANAPTASFTESTYQPYARTDAIVALLQNDVDMLLFPQGLTPDEIATLAADSAIRFVENRRNNLRFVLFNPASPALDEIALRRAIACLLDAQSFAAEAGEERIVPALGWIHPENSGWYTGALAPPCAGLDADARLAEGTRILKMAGYLWEQAPSSGRAGSGLTSPAGEALPIFTILAPKADSSRVEAASWLAKNLRLLGVSVEKKMLKDDAYFYALYGSQAYDIALVGWSLSRYPDYLCRFFGAENPYGYQAPDVETLCAQLDSTSDLGLASELVFKIEIFLWDDLPAVPLFSTKITEAYRNLSLPFDGYLGGLAGALYGAPALLTPER